MCQRLQVGECVSGVLESVADLGKGVDSGSVTEYMCQ